MTDFDKALKNLGERENSETPRQLSDLSKDEVFAIAARLIFAGSSDVVVAEALGKSKNAIARMRKKDEFQAYYKGYIEKQFGDVDIRLKARIRQIAPQIIERMLQLAAQDEHRQVSFHACKDLLDRYGVQPDITKQRMEVQFPRSLLDALRAKSREFAPKNAPKAKGKGNGADHEPNGDSPPARYLAKSSEPDRETGSSEAES